MKRNMLILVVLIPMIFSSCREGNKTGAANTENDKTTVTALTNDSFKKLVFDYEKNKEFKFEGQMPVIIDFYADWCAPCRQLSPLVETIAREYEGKIKVYKVDTEKEKLLAQNLGISGLPTLLFIPAEGMPRSSMGLISREDMIKAITDILLIK